MKSIKSYLIQGISGVFSVKISSTLLKIISSVMFARLMGPKEYGLYSFVLSIIGFVSVPVSLGLPNLLTREISIYNERKEFKLIKGLLRWSGKLVVLISMLMTVVLFFVILLFVDEPNKKFSLYCSLPLIFLSGLGQVRMGILRGLKNVVKSEIPEHIIRPVLVIFFCYILYNFFNFSISAKLGIVLNVISLGIGFIIAMFWLVKALPFDYKEVDIENENKLWLKEALPFFLLGSVAIINTQLSMVVLGFFRPTEEVGVYKIATIASTIVSFFLNSVNMTISPLISSLYFNSELDKLQRLLKSTVRLIFMVGVIISLIYLFFGRFFINLFYGPDYLNAYIPLMILTLGQLVNSAAGSVGNVLNMTGNQKYTVKGQAIAALSSVILNFILIPILGIKGAALATSISLIIWNIILLHFLKKKVGLKTSLI